MTHRASCSVWHTCGIAVNRKVRHWCGMSRDDLHFRLRIPPALKARVQAAAAANRRSMTAEIVDRLEQSFEPLIDLPPNEITLSQDELLSMDRLMREFADLLANRAERGLAERKALPPGSPQSVPDDDS